MYSTDFHKAFLLKLTHKNDSQDSAMKTDTFNSLYNGNDSTKTSLSFKLDTNFIKIVTVTLLLKSAHIGNILITAVCLLSAWQY